MLTLLLIVWGGLKNVAPGPPGAEFPLHGQIELD